MQSTYQNITTEVKARLKAEWLTARAFTRITLEEHSPEEYRDLAAMLAQASQACLVAASAKALVQAAPRTSRAFVFEVGR